MSLIIGIDPGTHTGFAAWDPKEDRFTFIKTLQIHRVILDLAQMHSLGVINHVIYEDAHLRRWFGNYSAKKDRAKLQGAGSIKRDCTILQDFLTDFNIPHTGIAPESCDTKWKADKFQLVTGWKYRTTEHSRDAALLVYKRKLIRST